MQFYQASTGNSFEATWIAADGDIVKDTPTRFREYLTEHGKEGGKVVFNSHGGNLLAGLQLGRIIRKEGLVTSIGRTIKESGSTIESLTSGVCESACAYAFLGGVDRYITPNGWQLTDNKLGFHQFYSDSSITKALTPAEASLVTAATLSDAQFITGLIAAYIVDMGIDATLVHVASKGRPEQMIYPSVTELESLGIINPKGFSSWFMEPYKAGLVAASKKKRSNTPYDLIEQVTLLCRSTDNQPIILLTSDKIANYSTTAVGSKKLSAFGAKIDIGGSPFSIDNTRIEVQQAQSNTLFFIAPGDAIFRKLTNSREFSISIDAPRASGGFHAKCSLDPLEQSMLKLARKNCI